MHTYTHTRTHTHTRTRTHTALGVPAQGQGGLNLPVLRRAGAGRAQPHRCLLSAHGAGFHGGRAAGRDRWVCPGPGLACLPACRPACLPACLPAYLPCQRNMRAHVHDVPPHGAAALPSQGIHLCTCNELRCMCPPAPRCRRGHGDGPLPRPQQAVQPHGVPLSLRALGAALDQARARRAHQDAQPVPGPAARCVLCGGWAVAVAPQRSSARGAHHRYHRHYRHDNINHHHHHRRTRVASYAIRSIRHTAYDIRHTTYDIRSSQGDFPTV
jgi:hypothetical protein